MSLATPLLMLSGSIAAQSAQSEGGAGFGSPIRSAESSQGGNGAISMKVMPERVTIVPELPERVEVLSLNNSLINFQRQDTIWNNIAAKMGKDAEWTLHTILGQPLSFHWMETDEAGCNSEGQPSAKSMIKLKPWTHIILQEQTDRPRVEYEDFRESVGKWVDFIRNNCPNPHAVIILPVNWVLTSCLDTYSETVNLVIDNYRKVAQEFGVVLAPVSSAYRMCYEREGVVALKKWYTDDRHPTIDAAYLAACIEYATIYGEDPTTISWAPRKISPQEALRIREYAKEALTDYTQTVDHHKGTVQLQARLYDGTGRLLPDDGMTEWVSNGAMVNHEGLFTAGNEMADYIVTATNGAIKSSATVTVAKAITRIEGLPVVELDGAEASYSQNFDTMGNSPTLPEGWRTDGQDGYARTLGYFVLANDETQFVQTDDLVTLDANAACGTWNFGQQSDRAVGGITSGRSNEPRVINVYLHVRNTGTTPIVQPLLFGRPGVFALCPIQRLVIGLRRLRHLVLFLLGKFDLFSLGIHIQRIDLGQMTDDRILDAFLHGLGIIILRPQICVIDLSIQIFIICQIDLCLFTRTRHPTNLKYRVSPALGGKIHLSVSDGTACKKQTNP